MSSTPFWAFQYPGKREKRYLRTVAAHDEMCCNWASRIVFLRQAAQRATMTIGERAVPEPDRIWRVLDNFCALHDSERHLGHVVRTDRWHAYDATHMNPQQDGIRYLGGFSDLETAKAAVEASVAQSPAWIF